MSTSAWIGPLSGWRSWMIASGRPGTTVKLRTYQLLRFADSTPDPWNVTTSDLITYLAGQDWAPETRRSATSALRSFYRWGMSAGLVTADPAASLPAVRPSAHSPRPAPEEAIAAALSRASERVALMIELGACLGLRRGEIARLHSDDVLARVGGGRSLVVHGKGDKPRVIPLPDPLGRKLARRPAGWVFPGQCGGHLSPAWVGKLISAALPDGWTAHTLRHRFGTVTYAGSRDLLAVQDLLGHASPDTTRRYVLMPDDAMRAALSWARIA